MKEAFRYAFPKTLPILTGYIFLGFSYGLLAISQGIHPWIALLMSIIMYSGTLQFAGVDILTSAFDPIGTLLLSLIINARHIFYGITMLKPYGSLDRKKYYSIFGLTDETFSLNLTLDIPPHLDISWIYFSITLLNHSYWILGSLLGIVFGAMIPFNTEGIEFVLVALFVSIFTDQWLTSDNHRPAIVGLLSGVVMLFIFGREHFMIPAMIMIIVILLSMRPKDHTEVVR